MSDESTEEKKPEEQIEVKLPIIEKFDEVKKVILDGGKLPQVKEKFDEIFEGERRFNYPITGNEKEVVDSFNELIQTKALLVLRGFWEAWAKTWERPDREDLADKDDLHTRDYFALTVLLSIPDNLIQDIDQPLRSTQWSFGHLIDWCNRTFPQNPLALEYIGRLLEKFATFKWEYTATGKKYLARALAIRSDQEQVYRKFVPETKKEIEELKIKTEEDTKQLEEKIGEAEKRFDEAITTVDEKVDKKIDKRLRESEQRSTRNFVQIIGIFAAIIAFVVTIVPTAVRMGGASIPVALAGLAIVTTGIIILLAMIFGRREKVSKSLITGISITGVLFAAWLVVTIWLAIYYPDILTSAR